MQFLIGFTSHDMARISATGLERCEQITNDYSGVYTSIYVLAQYISPASSS